MRQFRVILAILLTACVGPKFLSPVVDVPDTYLHSSHSIDPEQMTHWWRNFNDPLLDTLQCRAVRGNRNLAVAVHNIEIARLSLVSVRAQALPSVSLSGVAGTKYSYDTKSTQSYSAMPSISWEIDLWGKIRRQSEAAGASYRATEYEAAAILQTLTADVATTYFAALSYKMALEVAEQTFASREYSNSLMDSMFRYGWISQVDLSQSRASLALAGASVEQYRRALHQATLSLNLLLGENPRPLTLGTLPQTPMSIPSGLPSSLLERRPDVLQAYYGVQSANALVGVAVANRLPSLSLTGQGGYAQMIAKDLSTGKPLAWSASASLLAPILNWSSLLSQERTARLKSRQSLLNYEQAVLTAINEVEQALIAVATYNNEVEQNVIGVASALKASKLTEELYRAGNSSYLDVLDANRTLFSAQMQYSQTLNARLHSYITLYKALGGGW